jgi:1,4-alpha-glucan branching enzyme
MKQSHHDETGRNAGLQVMPVHFEYTHPTAATVCVAGSFNDWHPTTKAMHPAGNGRWLKVAFLLPGNYEYCLVVDGHGMPDPLAKDQVSNPFGGRNSVLKVASSPAAAHRAAAELLPLKNSNRMKTQKL